MRYIAIVAGEEYSVEIEESGRVTVDGGRYSARLESVDRDSLFTLLVGAVPYDVHVERQTDERHPDGEYTVTVEGNRYDVIVEDERSWRADAWRAETGAEVGEAVVRSPMPGVVVAVPVEEGQSVEAGDRVAILEAMKMENDIRAPCSGIVTSVRVAPGQTVNLDDIIASVGAAPDDAGD